MQSTPLVAIFTHSRVVDQGLPGRLDNTAWAEASIYSTIGGIIIRRPLSVAPKYDGAAARHHLLRMQAPEIDFASMKALEHIGKVHEVIHESPEVSVSAVGQPNDRHLIRWW